MTVTIPRILVVGLGNLPLPLTRHSVGHLIVDSLALRLGIGMTYDRAIKCYRGDADIVLNGAHVNLTLLKPKALMNITGPPVAAAFRAAKASAASMIVIHDSLSHKPQTVSAKLGGSANGHNGVRSIISSLGGETAFHRLRIGIGREGGDVAEYVLGKLSLQERQFWGDGGAGVDVVWQEIEKICRKTAG